MRRILSGIGSDERHTFRAKFGKYGYKRFHDEIRGELYSPTMVVRNVEIIDNPDKPIVVTDHLWLNLTKGFADLGLLNEGDSIQFNGRVAPYTKGYGSNSIQDYKLTYPSKVMLIEDREVMPIPDDHAALIGMIMNLNFDFYKIKKRPLVPFFMDSFKKWQESQTKPLSIECHEGNQYESDLGYDAINYQDELKAMNEEKQQQAQTAAENEKAGIAFLQDHPEWVDGLVKLAQQNDNQISNRLLNGFLDDKFSSKEELVAQRTKIKAALKSDWFKNKLSEDESDLSPLELLAKKLNSQ